MASEHFSEEKGPDQVEPAPFWLTLKADIERFQGLDHGGRILFRGLLSQGFFALLTYRIFRWFHERRIPTQPIRFLFERIIEITTGISLPAQARIGKGLRIHHFGGIILHPEVVLGEGCTIYQGVTLGDLGEKGGVPCVGNYVFIGTGAKILGNLTIGDHACIGANAVVLKSVPPGCVAVGVPAVIKDRTRDT